MITDEQFQAVKPIYERVAAKYNGAVPSDELIAEIDGSPATRELFFNADPEDIMYRYKLERVTEFQQVWAQRMAKRMIAVVTRPVRIPHAGTPASHRSGLPAPDSSEVVVSRHGSTTYYPIEQTWENRLVAESARRNFEHGLAMVKNYGPLCESWGQSRESLCRELQCWADNLLGGKTDLQVAETQEEKQGLAAVAA